MAGYNNKNKGKIVTVATTAALTTCFVGLTIFNSTTGFFRDIFLRPKPEKIDPTYGIVETTKRPSYSQEETETSNRIPSDREEHTVPDEVGIITEAESSFETQGTVTRPTRPNEIVTEPNLGVDNDFVYQPQPDAEKNPTHSITNTYETEVEEYTEPNLEIEPGIETEIYTEAEEFLETEAPIEVETDYKDITETEVTTQETVEILATLTNWLQEYLIETNNLSTTPDITVIGLDTMSVDESYNTFQINGTLKSSSKIRTFSVDVVNNNSELLIFNLPTNLDASTLDDAFNEVKNSPDTQLNLKLGQFITIENPTKIISSILTSRYNDVCKINSASTRTEAAYLSNVLKNINSCSIRVSTPSGIAYDDGYRYSFNTYINTGKYTYYTTHYFESERQLKNTELQTYVNNYLKSGVLETTTYVTSNSAINQFIHQINERAEEKTEDNSLTK